MQLVFPLSDAFFERFLVRAERHALCHDDVVVQKLRHFVADLDDVCSSRLVRHHLEVYRIPFLTHLVQRLSPRQTLAHRRNQNFCCRLFLPKKLMTFFSHRPKYTGYPPKLTTLTTCSRHRPIKNDFSLSRGGGRCTYNLFF